MRRAPVIVWYSIVLLVLVLSPASRGGGDATDFVRLMNRAKAHLENREAAKAVTALKAALDLKPRSPQALRNLARAHLLTRDLDAAGDALGRAREVEPESAGTSYLSGLALLRAARFADAVPHFERAVRLDPHTATLRFQLAGAYDGVGEKAKALEQLRETQRLDPLHGSAHYKLAMAARQAGDRAEFQRRITEFLRLREIFGDATRSSVALEQCIYTRPEAAPTTNVGAVAASTIEVHFSDATDAVFADGGPPAVTAACIIDMDEHGGYTLFVVRPKGQASLLRMSSSGKLEQTNVALQQDLVAPVLMCIGGNYHDDVPPGTRYDPKLHARNDVLVLSRGAVRLLKRSGPASFEDATAAAGLTGRGARTARWVDYEHDGDLDLLLARESGLELWQNNGNGTFQDVTSSVGIPAIDAVADLGVVDFDRNLGIDIVAARGEQPTLVLENQRAGRFAVMKEPPGPWPACRLVLLDDLNNDGNPDALLISDTECLVLYGRSERRDRIHLGKMEPAAAVLVDYDNDGLLDLCVAGRARTGSEQGAIQIWRNVGSPGWPNVSGPTGLTALNCPPVRGLIAADIDADGDTDLLAITTDDRLRFLRNDGGHKNGQLKLRLVATKTNRSGIGTHVEIRDGPFRVVRSISRLPIEIGLAGRKPLDAVQTVWTNGVVQNVLAVTPGPRPLTVVEKNVPTGSCPFLYAYDGRDFRFVTDLLGNSPVGLPLSRDALLPADPNELVVIGDAAGFPPRDGAYELEVTSEFREVLYLDQTRLVAFDHPVGTEVHVTDKLMPPPFPKSEAWVLGRRRPLRSAIREQSVDLTSTLARMDGSFAPPGTPLPPPLRGMCYPSELTLDFGDLDEGRPLVLALTGWLQYGDASTNIALSQNNSLTIIPPRLEVEVAGAGWQPVDVVVGMPAGKTKTILVDLAGKLPAGSRRLRLTTTFEIRWDRMALFERIADARTRRRELAATEARLRWRGFSALRTRAPQRPLTPDYAQVAERPAWRTSVAGWCTRYGDVLELVGARDGRMALLNGGDALRLRFDSHSLPPPDEGLRRTFLFYSVGWDKDGDANVASGDAVEPYPLMLRPGDGFDEPSADDWRVRYNTRRVSGDRFRPAK